MAFKIFNTLTRKKELFKPVGKTIKLYTCGPTVYNFAHIGNFRAYIFEDVLRRYLKYLGYKVKQVMNLTDVDDKTIRDSQKEKLPLEKFTEKYKKAFFEDIAALNIEKAEEYPEATKYIDEMVAIIKVLMEKGYAYKGKDNSIYYSIAKFKEYGKLAHIKVEDLKAGARVKHDEYEKANVADFALWKAWDKDDGDVFWETELGKGRPGWHIECSAMSMKALTKSFDKGRFDPRRFETIDIHTGGVDNMFPHHEDEIAQSEAATGKKFVNYWMHNEHLLVNNKKMSKSLGNFFTLRDLIKKGYDPIVVRYLLLSCHYRQQFNFTFKGLDAAKNSIERIRDFALKLKEPKKGKQDVNAILEKAQKNFEVAMDDDLNTCAALAAIFDMVHDINKIMDNLSAGAAEKAHNLLEKFDSVIGVLREEDIPKEIVKMAQKRQDMRKAKKFAEADKLRDELKVKGYVVEDTRSGIRIKKV